MDFSAASIPKQLTTQSSQLHLHLNDVTYTAKSVRIDQIDTFDLSFRKTSLPRFSPCTTLSGLLSLKQSKLAAALSIQQKSITINIIEEGNLELWKIEQGEKVSDRTLLNIIEIIAALDVETPPTISIDSIQLPIAFKGDLCILLEKKEEEINIEIYNQLEFYNGCVKGLRRIPKRRTVDYGNCVSKEYDACSIHDVINRIKTLILRNNKGLQVVKESDSFGELGLDSLELAEIEEIIKKHTKQEIGLSPQWSLGRIQETLEGTGEPARSFKKFSRSKMGYGKKLEKEVDSIQPLEENVNSTRLQKPKRSIVSFNGIAETETSSGKILEKTEESKHIEKLMHITECKSEVYLKEIQSITLSLEEKQLLVANEVHSESRAQFNETVSFRLNSKERIKFHTVYLVLIMQYSKLRTVFGPETIVLAGTECYQSFKEKSYSHWNLDGIDISSQMSVQLLIDKINKQNGRSVDLIGIKFHHIAVDGESMKLLLEEMNKLMKESSPEPKRSTVIPEYAESEPAHLIYWSELIGTHKNDPLPLGKTVSKSVNFKGTTISINLPLDFGSNLQRIPQASNFSRIASIFHIFLYKITQINRYCTGYAASNRTAEQKRQIGCFVQMLPLLVTVDPQSSLQDTIQTVAAQIKQSKRNMNVSFGEIVEAVGANSEALPLFQICLVLDRVASFDDSIDIPVYYVKYQQMWYFQEDSECKWRIRVEFMTDFHSEPEIKGLIYQFLSFVYKMTNIDPTTKIAEVSIINSRKLPNIGAHRMQVDYPQTSVLQIYSNPRNARSFWKSGDEIMNYEVIQKKSWQFARRIQQHYLQYYGITIRADNCAVLFVSRRIHQPLAVLSAWKAGLCVLPVSLDWPLERIQSVLRLLTNPVVITDDVGLYSSLSEVAVMVPIFERNEKSFKLTTVTLDDLAYITCTSGTTGVPKAVCTPFRGHSNLAVEYTRKFMINEKSVVYQVVNYGFDIFFADLDKVFANSASLVISMDKIPCFDEMSLVTNAYIMPAFISNIDLDQLKQLKQLESIHFGGEIMSLNAWKQLGEMDIHSYQEYGLTEQTVYTAAQKVRRIGDRRLIGSSYSNIRIINKDKDGQTMPYEYRGLISVQGMLARGYLSLATLNSSKFSSTPLGRLFSTGDICHFRHGRPYFVGRNDLQIKINGRRIEILEIQNCIEGHSSVDSCVVTVADDVISATIKWRKEEEKESLRDYLESKLPYYMVPAHLNTVHIIPLNANGKVDMKKLVGQDKRNRDMCLDSAEVSVNPSSEKELLLLMEKHLKIPVEKDENFFEKGGNSVISMIIIQEMKKKGWNIRAADFFKMKTATRIGKLCQLQKLTGANMEPLEKLELSSSQLRLWSLQEQEKTTDCSRINMEIVMSGKVEVARLLAAIQVTVAGNPFLRCGIRNEKGKPKIEMLSLTEVYYSLAYCESSMADAALMTLQFQKLTTDSYQLLIDIHHILVDDVSLSIICNQIIDFYYGKSVNFQFPKNKNDVSGRDWKMYLYEGKESKTDLKENRLVNGRSLPNQRTDTSRSGRRLEVKLSKYQEKLKEIAGSTDTTLFQLLVYSYVLSYRQIKNESDVIIGVTVANRDENNYSAIGMWTNTVPVRMNCHNTKGLLEVVKNEVLTAMDYGSCSLTEILAECGLKSLPFATVLNMQASLRDTVITPDFVMNCVVRPNKDAMFPQTWQFYWENGQLNLTIEYMTSLYSTQEINKWAEQFEWNIGSITGYCSRTKETSNLQDQMLTVYRSLIRNPNFSASSDFFKFGGNSLLAIELAFKLEGQFGVEVTVTDVIKYSTIDKMQQRLEHLRNDKRRDTEFIPVKKNEVSWLQKDLLRSYRDERIEKMYDISSEVELKMKVSVFELKTAVNGLIMHHPMLRTVFKRKKKEYRVVQLSGTETYSNLEPAPADQWSSVLQNPSLRLQLQPESNTMNIEYNHIIMDGHAVQLLINNLTSLLEGKSINGDTVFNYHAHLIWDYERKKQASLEYWRTKIDDLKSEQRTKNEGQIESATERTEIQVNDLSRHLKEISLNQGVTPFTVILTALSMALKREGLSTVIGYPLNIRDGSHKEALSYGIVILFTSQQMHSESIDNINLFWNELQLNQNNSYLPHDDVAPYQVLLTYDSYTIQENQYFKLVSEKSQAKVPLEVFIDPSYDDRVTVIYDNNRYSEKRIRNILNHVMAILRSWRSLKADAPSVPETSDQVTVAESFPSGPLPLSPQQLQMFFLSDTVAASNYILPHIFPLGPIDPARIHSVFHSIIQKNEMLRIRIFWKGAEPVQELLSLTESYHHLRIMDQSIDDVIRRECDEMREDRLRNSPLRMCIAGRGAEPKVAILVTHHVISDAWSTNILEKQMGQFLDDTGLEAKRSKYNYLQYTQEDICNPKINESYLSEIIKGIWSPEEKSSSSEVYSLTKVMSSDFIERQAKSATVTPFIVVLKEISVILLSEYSKDCLNVMLPYANRSRTTRNVVGCFLNNLVITIWKESTLQEISQKVNEEMNLNIPYSKLVEEVRSKTLSSSNELSCVYVNGRYDLEIGGADMRRYLPVTAHFPLEIDYEIEEEGKTRISLRTKQKFFTKEDTQRIFETFLSNMEDSKLDRNLTTVLEIAERVLKRKVSSSQSFIQMGGNSLQVIRFVEELEDAFDTELEVKTIYESQDFKEIASKMNGNDIIRNFPKQIERAQVTVAKHQQVESAAKPSDSFQPTLTIAGSKCDIPSQSLSRGLWYFSSQNPERTFISTDSLQYTYKDFQKRRNWNIRTIRNQYFKVTGCTIRSDTIIPVVSQNSPDTIIFCLSIIGAGAAYLPIDYSNPITRIAAILKESGAACYFGMDVGCSDSTNLVFPTSEVFRSAKIRSINQSEDMAYVICTSGTTGTPKMVCARHGSANNLMISATKDLWISPDDVIYQFTNFCYDNSVLEILMTVANSASFFLENGVFDPNRLSKAILKHRITHCLLFPGIVSLFRSRHLEAMRGLRYWITGAEKLPQTLLNRAIAAGIRVIQNYGPTETTAYCITRRMKTGDCSHLIGKPINNIELSIDASGLLYVNGACLMRGYMNGRKGTRYSKDCQKWYETGDTVTVLNGRKEVLFIGRADKQMKIRGHRVDPSEIEECARKIKGLQSVRVLQRSDRLVLFYSGELPELKEDDLRLFFQNNLPSFMVPDQFFHLKHFPLTKNSKVDEAKLFTLLENKQVTVAKDQPGLDAIWRKVLEHSNFDEKSNFLLVGGNSLKLMYLRNLCAEELGQELTAEQLLANLEFGQMLTLICKSAITKNVNEVRKIRIVSDTDEFTATVILVHPLYGGSTVYSHLIEELQKGKNLRILVIEQPIRDEYSSFENMVGEYAKQIKEFSNCPTFVMGASIGGTIAREISIKVTNCTAILIDSTSYIEELKEYKYEKHCEDLRSALSKYSEAIPESSFDDFLASSWQLLQYLADHKMCSSSATVTLLSTDGTDLGWSRLNKVRVKKIGGTHETMLNSENSKHIGDIIEEIIRNSANM